MKITKIKAKANSYGSKRKLGAVQYIVIHYTGVTGDTAKAEGNYFAKSNTRSAGAHYFVDRGGNVVESIPMDLIAWSVGGFYTQKNGAGKYYKKCTNANSVSIELCDIVKSCPSEKQTEAVRELVAYIEKKCPNAKTIIRHWDVNGKLCPARMAGTKNAEWERFKKAVTKQEEMPAEKPEAFQVKVTAETLNVRSGPNAGCEVTGKIRKREVYTIVATAGNWGKLKSGAGWINLNYTQKL